MPIIYPQTIDEAARLMREAAVDKRPVIPAGKFTALRYGPAAGDGALVISTRDLASTVSVEPENLLAIVEAGLTPAELDRILAPTGLYWPVTGQGRRTLGGIMAEGLPGAETMARGSMIDWVLGTALVSPEGRLVKSGGRTLKNVSGYDFTRLAWRSRGRLGLCVSFIVKLLPRPEAAPVLEIAVKGPAEAADLARSVITKRLWPEALRIVRDGASTSLLIWLTGFAEVAEAKAKAASELAEAAGSGPVVSHPDGFAFWEDRALKWPAADPAVVHLTGSRRAILELGVRLQDDDPRGLIRAELDVGGGRAAMTGSAPLPADRIAALAGSLIPDRFDASGEVYRRLKKGLDPDGRMFPESASEGGR